MPGTLVATVITPLHVILFLAAGIAAGIFNAIAGGGTLLAFPALLVAGVPALNANITAAVGIVPSYLGSIHGFRSEIVEQRLRVRRLLPTALAGGLCGALLLLVLPSTSFRLVVPWIVLAATALFAFQPWIIARLDHLAHDHPTRRILIQAGTFVVGIYGGYFGAGASILILAVLSIGYADSLLSLTGLRSVLAVGISLMSATVFILHGHVVWAGALCLAIGTLVGGVLGARLIRLLSPTLLRTIVVVVGISTTIALLA